MSAYSQVYSMLDQYEKLTVNQLIEKTGLSRSTISNALQKGDIAGEIERGDVTGGRNPEQYWILSVNRNLGVPDEDFEVESPHHTADLLDKYYATRKQVKKLKVELEEIEKQLGVDHEK